MSASVDLRLRVRPAGRAVLQRLRAVVTAYGLHDDLEIDLDDDAGEVFVAQDALPLSRAAHVMESFGDALRTIARGNVTIEFAWRADFEPDEPWIIRRFVNGADAAPPDAPPEAARVVTETVYRPVFAEPVRVAQTAVDGDERPCASAIRALERDFGPAVTGGPVLPEAIAAFEIASGLALPADFRAFVLAWGYVQVGPVTVFGIATEARHPMDLRVASETLAGGRRYPILRIDLELYVLDSTSALCRYDVDANSVDAVEESFESVLNEFVFSVA